MTTALVLIFLAFALVIVIVASAKVESTSNLRSSWALNIKHRRDQVNDTVQCEKSFYETQVGLALPDAIQYGPLMCTEQEIEAIGTVLTEAYDIVLAADKVLSTTEITLNTTLCPGSAVAAARTRSMQEADEGHRERERELLLKATTKYTYLWKGSGTCRLCTTDNRDKLGTQRRQLLQTSLIYEVIDFSVNSAGEPLGANAVVRNQWMDSHGMVITATSHDDGYSYQKEVRILDTAKPGNRTKFGSPNALCNGGGPGTGIGGIPSSPGKNCVPQGNALIIQRKRVPDNVFSPCAGVLTFTFLSPTRIGSITLLGIRRGTASIRILTDDGQDVLIPVQGLGRNSVEQVHIGYRVQNLKVVMQEEGNGAVTEIGLFVPSNQPEASSAQNASLFQEYIPYIQFDLSYYMTNKINDLFGSVQGGCLQDTFVQIDVVLTEVSELPISNAELNCGTFWTACPSHFSQGILGNECSTAGLQCRFNSTEQVAGENIECTCGFDEGMMKNTFNCYFFSGFPPKSVPTTFTPSTTVTASPSTPNPTSSPSTPLPTLSPTSTTLAPSLPLLMSPITSNPSSSFTDLPSLTSATLTPITLASLPSTLAPITLPSLHSTLAPITLPCLTLTLAPITSSVFGGNGNN